MKPKSICVLLFVINALFSFANMVLFADKISANLGGYFVSLGVVPFILGLVTSYILTAFSNTKSEKSGSGWLYFVCAELGAFIPIGYVVILLS